MRDRRLSSVHRKQINRASATTWRVSPSLRGTHGGRRRTCRADRTRRAAAFTDLRARAPVHVRSFLKGHDSNRGQTSNRLL